MTINSSKYLLDTSREYALYVCSNRAIPNIQDGLKHGQRVALWLLRTRAEKMKTVSLSGLMALERLYVHGDVSASNAISYLAAPYKNNVPLVEGLGQFGNRVDPDAIGAPRYTEVKRSKAAEAFLYQDIDLVPLRDNYDGSNQEPVHFLPLIPTVLLNGVEGIAVGWSTSILPRSFKGLIQATIDALNDAKTIRGLEPRFERYDVGVTDLGNGQFEFTGRVTLEDSSTLRINELPPGLSIEALRKRLIQMEDDETIVSFTDQSAEAIDITVKFKRGSIKDWTEAKALDFLKLRAKTTERIVVIDWKGDAIRTYADPADLVRDFAAWRLGWYRTRFEKMRDDASYELLYWLTIEAMFAANFTKKLGGFANKAEVMTAVDSVAAKAKIAVHPEQVERIVGLPTYRWNQEFEAEVKAKIADLRNRIDSYIATLADPAKLKDVYLNELDALKKLKF